MVPNNRKTIPVTENLWVETATGNKLMGSRCNACEEIFFPRKEMNFCTHCHREVLEDIIFGEKGHIVAFTKVEREPAGGFYRGAVPYTYGIVQLDEGVNIYSQLVEAPELEVGQKVELVIEKLYEEEEHDVMVFKFRSIDSDGKDGGR